MYTASVSLSSFDHPPALQDWFAEDYIHGGRFAELGDIRIEAESGPLPERINEAGRIVYCRADRVRELFRALLRRQRPCVLITHNSDLNITASLAAEKPSCVRHWFAQNVMVDHPFITPIPIGLERPHVSGGRAHPDVFRRTAAASLQIRNLAHQRHSDWTNRRERIPVRVSLAWRNWVTSEYRTISFPQYLQELAQHASVISPPGNGFDTHRTWEALYLGRVPIVKSSAANRYFARLFPMAVFRTLTTLTRSRVEREISLLDGRIAQDWPQGLRFSWWARNILSASNRLTDSQEDDEQSVGELLSP